MIMMIIGLHRIMIAKFIRYYNGLVLLFDRMGSPRSPEEEAEARGRCLSSSFTIHCWPLSFRPASTTTTRIHVLWIDLPPLPHCHRRRNLHLLLYLLPLLHPPPPTALPPSPPTARRPAFATGVLVQRRGG
jgi:hypothetical protein